MIAVVQGRILSRCAPKTDPICPRPTVSDIVCAYKSLTTRECNKLCPIGKLFQTSFYEHVIRNREDYDEIAQCILHNPRRWTADELYTDG